MKFSIIVPLQNSIDFVMGILDNLSKQVYANYEIVIVCDAEVEFTSNVFDYGRSLNLKIKIIKSTRKEQNYIYQAFLKSSGEIITIVDCIDEISPDKFRLTDEFFNLNPGISGIRYGFVRRDATDGVNYSLETVKSILRLEDIFIKNPVYFSDGFFRRELFENFFSDITHTRPCPISSLAINFYSNTLLAGCKIVGLNEMIDVRYWSNKKRLDIKRDAEASIKCLEEMFSNPKYASSIAPWKDKGTARAYLRWSLDAFLEHETELGQEFFRKSIELDRSILDTEAQEYFNFLIKNAIQKRLPVDTFLKSNVSQLSPEFAWMLRYLNDAIARGYFFSSISELAFGRSWIAYEAVSQVKSYGYKLKKSDLITAIYILSEHENVYGSVAIKAALKDLTQFGRFIKIKDIRWIKSTRLINIAFENYRKERYQNVPMAIINAMLIHPTYFFNWGIASIFIKSLNKIARSYL